MSSLRGMLLTRWSLPARYGIVLGSGLLGVLHGCVKTGRWLLPWLAMLLVSTSLALAFTSTISGFRATGDREGPETALGSVLSSLPPAGVVTEGPDGPVVGRTCVSLFGSYNGWLFSSGGYGACGLEPDAAPGSAPDR
jgi:hypothetical protein